LLHKVSIYLAILAIFRASFLGAVSKSASRESKILPILRELLLLSSFAFSLFSSSILFLIPSLSLSSFSALSCSSKSSINFSCFSISFSSLTASCGSFSYLSFLSFSFLFFSSSGSSFTTFSSLKKVVRVFNQNTKSSFSLSLAKLMITCPNSLK